ncbi:MAG TPA: DUF2834 domain-containing protein [Anaerolineales bacterium]|nr:DUF2834 domain-containing protein [Anaerolineales bacterium]
MKNIFLILAIVGFIVPYYFFLQLPAADGFNLPSLIQPFFANNFMKGAAMDLTISVIVFWVSMFAEANRLQMKNSWLYVLATLLVGLSFALPLFLYFRERQLEAR